MKKIFKSLIEVMGYRIIKQGSNIHAHGGFELYQYHQSDGTFDYEQYKQIQINGNKKKIDNIWVKEENIEFLSYYIKQEINPVRFGLCHGTRRGKEQEWFRKYLGCEVIGTEISDTAEQFPDTIQWDFHNVKPEWKNSVDFIYSNSLDHSYDPKLCLDAWMSCLNNNGLCLIEHTSWHEHATELDPFGASIITMPYLVLSWGEGKYSVREILVAPSKPESLAYLRYLVIQKNIRS